MTKVQTIISLIIPVIQVGVLYLFMLSIGKRK
jgi:hypothetical protein